MLSILFIQLVQIEHINQLIFSNQKQMKQRCYFHKNQCIQHFCVLKQCTLPLCSQCLIIHQQQHHQRNQLTQIISYEEAYQQVYRNLSNFIQENREEVSKHASKIKKDKQQAILGVYNYYKEFQQKIKSQSEIYAQVEQKFEKLKKGSIKAVIYYYSGQINLRELHFPQFKQISFQLNRFLQQLGHSKVQQMQTFRQNHALNAKEQRTLIAQQVNVVGSNGNSSKPFFNQQLTLQSHIPSSTHKNTNQPYVQHSNSRLQNVQNNTYTKNYNKYQRQVSQEQKSEVSNYFNHETYNLNQAGRTAKQNQQKNEAFNKYQTKMNYQKNEAFKKYQPKLMYKLKDNVYQEIKDPRTNVQTKQIRSKTMDRFPSMNELHSIKQNQHSKPVNQQQKLKDQRKVQQLKPGKWNKNNFEQYKNNFEQYKNNFQLKQTTTTNQRPRSTHSQLQVGHSANLYNQNHSTECLNRKPLKTTDLQTYTPTVTINPPAFQSRQRASSHEIRLRTTVSHNNLPSTKSTQRNFEPLLGQNLKRQVLSPNEIRKMLQKKIEQRNKILTQKKEHNLKDNTDRNAVNTSNAMGNYVNTSNPISRNKNQKLEVSASPIKYQDQNYGNSYNEPYQQKSYGYNTKDSIINQIYRQTKY